MRLRIALIALIAACTTGAGLARGAAGDHVTRVAGTGTAGFAGDGRAAVEARLADPLAVAALPGGGFVIADTGNARLREVDARGVIRTIAGNGERGSTGDGQAATAAALGQPRSVAVGPDGTIYVAQPYRVRAVKDGVIRAFAGTGIPGDEGDGGPATAARFDDIRGIAVDGDALYVADTNNNRIRRVGPDGTVTSVAGTGAADFSGDGGPAVAARLNRPEGVSARDGAIVVSDSGNGRVRVIGADGVIRTIAGGGRAGSAGPGSDAGDLSITPVAAVSAGGATLVATAPGDPDAGDEPARLLLLDGTRVAEVATAEACAAPAAAAFADSSFCLPRGLAVTPGGGFLVADTAAHAIRSVPGAAPGPAGGAGPVRAGDARIGSGGVLTVALMLPRPQQVELFVRKGSRWVRVRRYAAVSGRKTLRVRLPKRLRRSRRVRVVTRADGRRTVLVRPIAR